MNTFDEKELDYLAMISMDGVEEFYKEGKVPTPGDLFVRMSNVAGCSLTEGTRIVHRMEKKYKTRLTEIGYFIKIPCSP